MNAAVFKMLICRNEMHSSEPGASSGRQRCSTAARGFCSAVHEEQPANASLCRRRPSDSAAVLFYLRFKHSVQCNYAPGPWRWGRVGAAMLMQGYGILLASEVWPSPPQEGAFLSQPETGCVLGPLGALQEEYLLSGLHS